MLTESQLRQILPLLPLARLQQYLPHLNEAMRLYDIGTVLRTAAFVAQTAHESGQYNRMLESLNYTKASGLMATWPRRFPTEASALPFVRNEEKLANFVYANRMGNGDPASGDGFRYRGRGVIQLTGREGYQRAGDALGLDLVAHPELAQTPEVAFKVAGLYWKSKGLNELADVPDFKTITLRINGGLTGLADRQKYFDVARRVLAGGFIADAPVSRGATRGRGAPVATPAFSRGWQDSPDRDDLAPAVAGVEAVKPAVARKGVARKATTTKITAIETATGNAAARKTATTKPANRKASPAKPSTPKSAGAKVVAKKTATRKTAAKKTAARKVATRTVAAEETPARKIAPKARSSKTAVARKVAAKKSVVGRSTARAPRTAAKKAPTKKAPTKKAPRKTATKPAAGKSRSAPVHRKRAMSG